MTKVIAFPLESFWCCACGKQLVDSVSGICVYSCTVNGHPGSMIYCRRCLDIKIEQSEESKADGTWIVTSVTCTDK